MHFSAVALPAFAGVALAVQMPAAGAPANAPNTGKLHSGAGSIIGKMPSATTTLLTTATTLVVPTPDVTIVAEVFIAEGPHGSTTAVATGTKTVTSTATPRAKAIAPATSTKTLASTTTTIYKPTPAITKAPTKTVDVTVELDDPSDNQPPATITGRILSPVLSSAATRRVPVPGIFRFPVQVWKVVSGLFLQGAVVNAHETPRTVTDARTRFVDYTTTEADTTVYVLPPSTVQVWDDPRDNIPPQTVSIALSGDRVVATKTLDSGASRKQAPLLSVVFMVLRFFN